MSHASTPTAHSMMSHNLRSDGPDALNLQKLFLESWRLFVAEPLTYILAGLILTAGSLLSVGILAPSLLVGFIRMIDKHRREQPIEAGDVLAGLQQFGLTFVTGFLAALGIALASSIFVVPGVVLAVLWSFSLHRVALAHDRPTQALAESWHLTWRHAGSVLLILLACLALSFIGSLLVFGWVVTTPLGLIALTLSYCELHELPSSGASELAA